MGAVSARKDYNFNKPFLITISLCQSQIEQSAKRSIQFPIMSYNSCIKKTKNYFRWFISMLMYIWYKWLHSLEELGLMETFLYVLVDRFYSIISLTHTNLLKSAAILGSWVVLSLEEIYVDMSVITWKTIHNQSLTPSNDRLINDDIIVTWINLFCFFLDE